MSTIATEQTLQLRGLSVCPSVTLVHPAKAVGLDEMAFDRNACATRLTIVLDRDQFSQKERTDL